MRAREREMRDRGVVEFGAEPGVHGMAARTILGETALLVRRIQCGDEIAAVAR
jgi:hypothetical protein